MGCHRRTGVAHWPHHRGHRGGVRHLLRRRRLLGFALPAEYIGDYALALLLGIAFQYFAIAPMRGLGVKDGLRAAAKTDFLSLTAFEVGLFG